MKKLFIVTLACVFGMFATQVFGQTSVSVKVRPHRTTVGVYAAPARVNVVVPARVNVVVPMQIQRLAPLPKPQFKTPVRNGVWYGGRWLHNRHNNVIFVVPAVIVPVTTAPATAAPATTAPR